MTKRAVRCPYCVLGYEFRPMQPKPEGWFLCARCGHTTMPGKADCKCSCQKCAQLQRAA